MRTILDLTPDAGAPGDDGLPDPSMVTADEGSIILTFGEVEIHATVSQFCRLHEALHRWWTGAAADDETL